MTWRDKLELGLKDDAAFRRDNLPSEEVHGPEEAPRPGRSPVVTEVRHRRRPTRTNSVVQRPTSGDAAAEAQGSDMENEGQGQRRS